MRCHVLVNKIAKLKTVTTAHVAERGRQEFPSRPCWQEVDFTPRHTVKAVGIKSVGDAWQAQSGERATLDLWVLSSRPTLRVQIT